MYFAKKDLKINGNGYIAYKKIPIHRIIWEEKHGKIPKGMNIHHIDGNKYNNSIENLDCLTVSAHLSLHAKARREFLSISMRLRNEKLHEWHRSPEGKKFISERSKRWWKKRKPEKFTCGHCKKEFKSKHVLTPKYCGDNCVMYSRRARGDDNEERTCRVCANIFTINKYQKTQVCSMGCRNKWLKELRNERTLHSLTCTDCGVEYKAQQPKRSRFCSKRCAQRFRIRSRKKVPTVISAHNY